MKISQKILLYMLPLVILPLLILGGFSYLSLNNNTIERVKYRLNTYWFQSAQQIQHYYKSIEATQLLMSKSNLLSEYYLQDTEQQPLQSELLALFAQYTSSYQDIYEIRLLSPKGLEQLRYSTTNTPNVVADESATSYFVQLKNMTDKQGTFLIINPDNQETALLSVTKLYFAKDSSEITPELSGYLVFTVKPMVILDVVNNQDTQSSVSFITDSNGTILFSAQTYLQGTSIPSNQFTFLQRSMNNDQVVEFDFNGIDMSFKAGQLPNGYILTTGFSQQEVLADRKYLGLVSLITTTVVMFMVPFLLYYFLKILVLQPIAELTVAKRAVGKGHLGVRLNVHDTDEIGELYAAFNGMVMQLQAYRQRDQEHKMYLDDKISGRTKALEETNRELEQANQELQRSRSAAEQASELKSSFLANMSHEIRTPLTAVIGFTEQAMNIDIDLAERQDYLQRVLRSGQHLLHLINEILDLSKIEADKLELEHKPINFFELIADVEAINVALAEEKSLHFVVDYEFPLPQIVNGDLYRLRQVLLNLCSNAVKFTKQGTVSLTISYLSASEEVKITVQDSGIGMSKQELERLFQPFVQADSTITRKFGGSGLGLVISQKLTQLMNGRLEVESIKGLGSRFDVIIPLGTPIKTLLHSMPEQASQLTAKDNQLDRLTHGKVLVAEDNPDNQYLIQLLLRHFDVSFQIVDNGQSAVESAIYEYFDLILMDILMPVMGGCEAVQLLRQSNVNCPIIALTANIMKEDIDYYLKIGFNATLAKPIEQHSFYQTINDHLTSSAQTDENLSELESDKELRQLKDNFREGLGGVVENFSQYLLLNDWHQLQEYAHAIKGSAGSMGFPQLTKQAEVIENYLKKEHIELAKQATHQFIQMCQQYA